jgi:DNA gyrase subunit B
VTYNELSNLLEKKKKIVNVIAKQAEAAAKGREAAKKARSLVIRKSALDADDKTGLLEKLADVTQGKVPIEETTLFLVEGDSAGGSARQARDRNYHAILPLRGKIINAEKTNVLRVLSNNEVKAIVAAIGAGFGADFDIEDMRYGRIAIFTDADVDGFHIRTLLYTLFWRYMRPLIDEGRLYIAEAPLYRVYNGKKEVYCYTEKERRKAMKKLGSGSGLQRYKGLGEMSPHQLRATTFEPGGERLVPVAIDDQHTVIENMRMLMGSKSAPRKEWIMETWDQDA